MSASRSLLPIWIVLASQVVLVQLTMTHLQGRDFRLGKAARTKKTGRGVRQQFDGLQLSAGRLYINEIITQDGTRIQELSRGGHGNKDRCAGTGSRVCLTRVRLMQVAPGYLATE